MTLFDFTCSGRFVRKLLPILLLLTIVPSSVAAQQESTAEPAPQGSAEQQVDPELTPQERAQQALEKGDVALALAIYQRRAYAGEAWAQILLGQINQRGRLVEPSIANAVDWYARAAASGSPEAQYRLGLIFCDEQNANSLRPAKCINWLQQAAGKKHPAAMYQLASYAFQGRYISTDLESSLKLAKQAADGGVDEARDLVSTIEADLKSFTQKVRILNADIIGTRYNLKKSTLRLAAFKNKAQLERFVLNSSLGKLYAYEAGSGWVLSHGSFNSRDLAMSEATKLDKDMYNLEPTAVRWSEVLSNLQSSPQ